MNPVLYLHRSHKYRPLNLKVCKCTTDDDVKSSEYDNKNESEEDQELANICIERS